MTETKKLQGKVAVITGGTTGIGLATARLFVKEGAYVFITSRRQKELDEAVKTKGKIDVVFANAGVAEFCSHGNDHGGTFQRTIQHQCQGNAVHSTKGPPLMNDGGSIILNGSVASVKGTLAFGVYGATKAALRSFVRTWTSDLKDRHIRSNVVSPSPTDTPAIDGQPADAIARIVSTIPMGRTGDPDEIAKAALFLASDDASFVTRIELFVDGVMNPFNKKSNVVL